MDENFPVKRFKSNKMINRATLGSEPTLHVSKQVMGLEIPDKSTIDHSFHGFTDATCQSNRAIISRICGILTRLWNRNYNSFPPIRRKVPRDPDFIKKVSWALRRASCNSSKEKGLLYTSAFSDEKLLFCFSALQRTDAKASVLKAEDEL